jgi:hypothetical protein
MQTTSQYDIPASQADPLWLVVAGLLRLGAVRFTPTGIWVVPGVLAEWDVEDLLVRYGGAA